MFSYACFSLAFETENSINMNTQLKPMSPLMLWNMPNFTCYLGVLIVRKS